MADDIGETVDVVAIRTKGSCVTSKSSKTALIASLAAVLWIVPSIGTQGMGTIGQRFSHPDAGLADGNARGGTTPKVRAVLRYADAVVESAMSN